MNSCPSESMTRRRIWGSGLCTKSSRVDRGGPLAPVAPKQCDRPVAHPRVPAPRQLDDGRKGSGAALHQGFAQHVRADAALVHSGQGLGELFHHVRNHAWFPQPGHRDDCHLSHDPLLRWIAVASQQRGNSVCIAQFHERVHRRQAVGAITMRETADELLEPRTGTAGLARACADARERPTSRAHFDGA